MKEKVQTDWSLSCRICSASFITSQCKVTSEGFLICPSCNQWSGHEMTEKKLRPARCSVFSESQDRLIGELWAWVTINPKTTLEGLCGVMIDNVPRRAIADTFEEAMKFLPFLERAKAQTGKRFKLVKFLQTKIGAEL